MLIGLMGKSGSGKTTISNLFKERNDKIQVIDIDKIGHNSHNDPEVKERLLEYFGMEVFNEDFTVNRKKLSAIVLVNSEMMKKVCEATYDWMKKEIDRLIQNSEITILDYALLSETKYFDMCNIKILVEAQYENRKHRVTKRDNISMEKFDEINANSLDYSNVSFDYIIVNNGDIEQLRKVVGEIYEKSIVSS